MVKKTMINLTSLQVNDMILAVRQTAGSTGKDSTMIRNTGRHTDFAKSASSAPQPRPIRISQDVRDRYADYRAARLPADPKPAYWMVLGCGHMKHMHFHTPIQMGDHVVCQICQSRYPQWMPDTTSARLVIAAGVCDCAGCGGDSWLPRGTSRVAWLAEGAGGQKPYLISRDADGNYHTTAQV